MHIPYQGTVVIASMILELSKEDRFKINYAVLHVLCGPGNSVGIAGRSGDWILAGAIFSAPVQTGSGPHPVSCTMGTGSFPAVKSGQGVTLTPQLPSCAVGHERVELYLYSPYGSYGLYRASVPVQGCTLPFFYSCSVLTAHHYMMHANARV